MSSMPILVKIEDARLSVPTIHDLSLCPLNVEKGSQRFPENDGVTPPQALTWRNNLTALSQKRNLLFVAYNHQIYIWEPAGPRQVLGRTPTMILTPVMRDADAEGYISVRNPHGINNILVDELGRDEILLLATDSGNVCGYHVESIFSHIESSRSSGSKRPILPRIDPFFYESVGLSAWGLAVHKYARLIAVSANTGIITVFAFALVDSSSEVADEPSSPSDLLHDYQNYGQNWLHIDHPQKFEQFRRLYPGNRHRSRNVKLSYEGHFTNIPSVAFFNSDLDSDGMWMVSTDIDNRLFVWAIWDQFAPFKEFGFAGGEPFPGVLRQQERGWSVLALDPRSFRIYQNNVEACGGLAPFRGDASSMILDITNLSQYVPNTSFVHNPFPPSAKIAPEEPTIPDIFDKESRFGSERYVATGENLTLSLVSDREECPTEKITNEYAASTINRQAIENTDRSNLQRDELELTNEPMTIPSQIMDPHYSDTLQMILQTDDDILLQDDSEYDGTSDEEDAISDEVDLQFDSDTDDLNRETSRVSSNIQIDEDGDEHHSPYAPAGRICTKFPILHFSETDIRLLESPFADHPTVIAGGPLRQQLPRMFYSLDTYDRFNMVKYLTEPGIVVAATQKGRVAIISLTQVADRNIALRIHWMLPLASQEQGGSRPVCGLLGLAVSPIQGFEKQPDISYVPRGVTSREDFLFHYRTYEKDSFDAFQDWGSRSDTETESNESDEMFPSSEDSNSDVGGDPIMHRTESSRTTIEVLKEPELTFAQSHGAVDWTQKAQEPWHGLSSSRHYRVLLTYADHTVMSYEFWYEWSDVALGGYTTNVDGKTNGNREDHLLL